MIEFIEISFKGYRIGERMVGNGLGCGFKWRFLWRVNRVRLVDYVYWIVKEGFI